MAIGVLPMDAYAAETDEPIMTMELPDDEAMVWGEGSPVESESVAAAENDTDTGEGADQIEAPTLNSVETLTENDQGVLRTYVSVSWEGFEGITNYEILRKTPGGDWETAGYSAESPFADFDAVRYNEYVYTVRCVDENGEPISSYDETGITHFHPSGTCGETAGWKLTADGLLTISGSGKMSASWNMEQSPWYALRSNVKQVKVETGITSVAPYAFQGCTALTSAVLADTVQEIGQCAFFYCHQLKQVNLPEGITEIPYRTFYLCTGLTGIELPSTLKTIGSGAFDTCTWLADVELPGGLTVIEKGAFSGCDSITEMVIPQGVTELPMNAFRSCSALASVTLPEGLKTVGAYAFADCAALEKLTIPDSVTSVGTEAFADGDDGMVVTFLGSAPNFEGPVFRDKGTVIYLLSQYESWSGVDADALGEGAEIKCLDEESGEYYYQAVPLVSAVREGDGIRVTWESVPYADTYWLVYAADDSGWGEYFVGVDGITGTSYLVTGIPPGADYYFDVYAVDAGGTVVSVDNYEMLHCYHDKATGKAGANLTWSYKDGILLFTGKGAMAELDTLSLDNWWYFYRQEVERIILPEGLTHISAGAFDSFKGLTQIVIPSTVKTIGDGAFYMCDYVQMVYFRSTTPPSCGTESFRGILADGFYPQNQSAWTDIKRNRISDAFNWKTYSASNEAGYPCDMPVLRSADATSNGIRVTWEPVLGADQYYVYRHTGDQKWKLVSTVSNGTSYLDTNVTTGNCYIYTVRALTNGIFSSWFDRQGVGCVYLAAPKVSLASTADGVRLSWAAVSGADDYRVYRVSEDGSSQLIRFCSFEQLSYTDMDAEHGEVCRYYVEATGGMTSARSETVTICYLLQPELKLTMEPNGITVSWNEIEGADGYWVFRKGPTGSWVSLTKLDSETLRYTDTSIASTSGTVYYYTVRAMKGSYLSTFNTTTSLRYLAQPVVNAANTETGIKISWPKVAGAAGYSIYRRTENGSWSTIKKVGSSVLQYVDPSVNANSGTKYYYTVRAYNGSTLSTFDADKSIMRLTQPVIKLTMAADGITVNWNKVEGADGYWLFRKGTTGSWTSITKLDGDTFRYTDTAISGQSGSVYYYTVRAMYGDTLSTFNMTTSLRYLAQPVVSMANAANGITVAWKQVKGAAGYCIYRRTEDGSWSTIKKVSSSVLKYTDTAVSGNSGTKYYYTVRAYNGSLLSTFDAERSIMRLAQPAVKAANGAEGAVVSWTAVPGADSYWVFRKTASSSWRQFATVSGDTVSLVDPDVLSGTTYYYTVRAAYDGVLSSFTSSSGLLYLAQPTPTAANEAGGIRVSWDQTAGAQGYKIYRRTESGNWSTIATVKSGSTLTYLDTAVKGASGQKYFYTVRAYNGSVLSTFYSGAEVIRGS